VLFPTGLLLLAFPRGLFALLAVLLAVIVLLVVAAPNKLFPVVPAGLFPSKLLLAVVELLLPLTDVLVASAGLPNKFPPVLVLFPRRLVEADPLLLLKRVFPVGALLAAVVVAGWG